MNCQIKKVDFRSLGTDVGTFFDMARLHLYITFLAILYIKVHVVYL